MLHSAVRPSALRRFLDSQSSAGLVLMAAAALALVIANSPLASVYGRILAAPIGPLSVEHWVNDALMAIFFLLVGLELKRELLEGQLSTWSRRILPGIAAAGGMAVPSLIYLAFNSGPSARGWAIPAATDIAFALGVLALLGPRVPMSLRVFLTALAIIDDLGAVIIIALFYSNSLSVPDLGAAALVVIVLIAMNRSRVRALAPYLLIGAALWFFVFRSGLHATLAGVILALIVPLRSGRGKPGVDTGSPLLRLERWLHLPVGFVIVPIFGLANAGVSLSGLPAGVFAEPVTVGIALGLLLGKPIGVLGASFLAIRLGLADMPAYAGRLQFAGVALLCGIGFTMSLFITLLAFPTDMVLQAEAKIGILCGSLLSGIIGYAILRVAPMDTPPTPSR